ncbi:MAG: hydroxymethylbilane synthase [Candidatus Zixiibacteriota bacterium]|nr:MAG: hydroxymethylbilane synthase [candidate division Zixibacteria bacterium]
MNARMLRKLIIGSRGSELALYQAELIRSVLRDKHSCDTEITVIKTRGDKLDQLAFDKMEGKGFFTKEIEDALLAGQIDLAVHSLKDLMTTQPEGLKLGAVGYRADRRELLLINKDAHNGVGILPIKSGGTIGTSSARRKCQIAHHNPTLVIEDLRGNVPTRLRKLRSGDYDAIIIAVAGVERLKLDISDLKTVYLNTDEFLPAPGQGILGIQIRSNDPEVETIISKLEEPDTALEASLERGLLARFDSGCSLPLGVSTQISGKQFRLNAVLGQKDDDNWSDLRVTEVTGTYVNRVIDEAYRKLTEGTP